MTLTTEQKLKYVNLQIANARFRRILAIQRVRALCC